MFFPVFKYALADLDHSTSNPVIGSNSRQIDPLQMSMTGRWNLIPLLCQNTDWLYEFLVLYLVITLLR